MPRQPRDYLLNFSDQEKQRLVARIDADYTNALSDHKKRMDRFMRMYRSWRDRYEPNPLGEENASNFRVPLTRWYTWTKLAKTMDSLFGEDAEVVAIPTGPSDERNVRKVSRYMSWRVLDSMRLVNPLTTFEFRGILFGRSHAFAPWNEAEGRCSFIPLWPDDFVVPAEEVDTLHDFSFVLRRYPVTPNELLIGESEGRYDSIRDHRAEILTSALAGDRQVLGDPGDQVKSEKDEAEGVIYQSALSARQRLQAWSWNGRWRRLKPGVDDADEFDLDRREELESDLVVDYLPDVDLIIGVKDLAELYPQKKRKRPFVETSLCKDGSYWSPGFGELLREIEGELSQNHNIATEAGEISVGPMVFYRPAAGFRAETFRYEPRMAVPVDNPQTDVNVISLRADLNFAQVKEAALLAYAERLTGLTDVSMGRALDRPNSPRTATQYVSLLEEGNVRASLDVLALREDMSAILDHIWEMDTIFSDDSTFFRVTEEQAGGLFAVRQGGARLRRNERQGQYDFRLKFATSIYSREQRKQTQIALYQSDIQNPLIVQNPRALWHITNALHEALGDHQFRNLIPEPPDTDISVPPREEWVRILQGEDVHVRPGDDDQLHMTEHDAQILQMQRESNPDPVAIRRMEEHYVEHARQLQQKKLQQMLLEQVVTKLPQLQGALQGGGLEALAGAAPAPAGPMNTTAGAPGAGGPTNGTARQTAY